MFDVPVLEVTVSSAPTITNSVSQANPVALSKPQISSVLLNALAVLTQPVSISPGIEEKIGESTVSSSSSQALFSSAPFQLLEPLDLANSAADLETIFSLPLELDILAKTADASPLTASSSTIELAASSLSAAKTDSSYQASATTTLKSAAEELAKASPTKSNKDLSQCLGLPQLNSQDITKFQVVRQGTVIGEVNDLNSTGQAVTLLQGMLQPEEIVPHEITPVLGNGQPAIRLSRDVLLQVVHQTEQDVTPEENPALNSEWAAITWSDQLRQALGSTPLDAGNVQVMLKGFQPSGQQLDGLASWYGPYFHGRLTANGEIFDQNTLTAAHKTLPFGTVLQVRNLKNNRSVVVRINDRGPYIGKRSLDLSKAAAQCLGSETAGVIPYEATILEHPSAAAAKN
ncbi:septal ring lytic transglycosylase RlpA family protein [Leptothoe sp. PORK10 BA2]|uniref:septal ring lytic transglycosylase RlpA family protein n=1 Tax=Leptothoe sp. PORK10 BA2 TaxID=3110254 RepID=UPI002B216481|nr:septal ring lytic transglycosylase RlpA family protein [Leptothoe sp. PORK10 BA2]MEA5462158.1 septal ring lytic transglycosylase RlpA family protein [Leptothoe sp. PORK10 BA2]